MDLLGEGVTDLDATFEKALSHVIAPKCVW